MPILLTLLSLLIPSVARGQSPSPGPPFGVTGASFAVVVPDLAASSQWYQAKLGLEVSLPVTSYGKTSVTILRGGGLTVELIHNQDAVPPRTAAPSVADAMGVHGLAKVGIAVADFDRLLAWLRERGVAIAFGPFPASPTQAANLIIRDDNGNLIQFVGPGR